MESKLTDLNDIILSANAVSVGTAVDVRGGALMAFQALGTVTSGTGAASVDIEVSNDPTATAWIKLGTIDLTLGLAQASDGFVSQAPWTYVRANLKSISGTGANVQVYLGLGA